MTQLDPVTLQLLRRHDVIDRDTLQKINNEGGVGITVSERVALLGGICTALIVVGMFTHAVITGDIRDGPTAKTLGMLYIFSMPWIIWFGMKHKRFGKVAAAMLKHQRCCHCGYDIRGLPVDPADGATVCPECGCAWKLAGGSAVTEAEQT